MDNSVCSQTSIGTPYDPEADPKNSPNQNNELRPLFLSIIGTMLIFLTLGTIVIASCLTEGCNWLTDQRFINDTSAIGDVTGVYSFDRATRDELLTKGLIADGDGKLALFKDGSVRRLDGHLVIRTFERTQQSQVCLRAIAAGDNLGTWIVLTPNVNPTQLAIMFKEESSTDYSNLNVTLDNGIVKLWPILNPDAYMVPLSRIGDVSDDGIGVAAGTGKGDADAEKGTQLIDSENHQE